MESQGKVLTALKEEIKANKEELKANKEELKANRDEAEKTQHLLLKALENMKQQPHAPESEITRTPKSAVAAAAAAPSSSPRRHRCKEEDREMKKKSRPKKCRQRKPCR